MKKYDSDLVRKIAEKTNQKEKSVIENISRRALKNNVIPEAELANWARSLNISANKYIKQLPPDIKRQIYSASTNPNGKSLSTKSLNLRIIKIGSNESTLYNQLWFQIVVLGLAVNVISQIIGAWLTNLLHLTYP